MLSKVIGIISYLPDDKEVREYRKNKLSALIDKAISLFNLPIMIIAQNYSEEDIWDIKNKDNKILIYDYIHKLGITGARKVLREKFLKSSYDYLIMIDDDVELIGNSSDKYLSQIDKNPDCFIENFKSRLQLFAISRTIFEKQNFNDIEAERGEGFEDRIFFYTLCKRFPEAHKKFINTGIEEHAIATKDKNSTWYKDQDLKSMLEKTSKILDELA